MSILIQAAIYGVVVSFLVLSMRPLMRRRSASERYATSTIAFASLLLFPLVLCALPKWQVLPTDAVLKFTVGGTESQTVTPGELPDFQPALSPPSSRPAISRPSKSQPALSQPALSQPALSQPALSQPVLSQPATPAPSPLLIPASASDTAGTVSSIDSSFRAAETSSQWNFQWSQLLIVTWLLGAVTLLLRLTVSFYCLRRLTLETPEVTTGRVRAILDSVLESQPGTFVVQLRMTDRRTMPMTWGFRESSILLPMTATDWERAHLESVLRHELEHIRRGDIWSILLIRVVCALHWFNPLIWICSRYSFSDAEKACDDGVLRSGVSQTNYALHLLQTAMLDRPGEPPLAALAMAQAATAVEDRIHAILNMRTTRMPVNRFRFAWLAAGGLSLMLMAAVLRGEPAPVSHTPSTPSAEDNAEPVGFTPIEQARSWIQQLDDDSYSVRESAQKSLLETSRLDDAEIADLLATATDLSLEQRTRSRRIIAELIARGDVPTLKRWKQMAEMQKYHGVIDDRLEDLHESQEQFEEKVKRAVSVLYDPRRTQTHQNIRPWFPSEVRLFYLDFQHMNFDFLAAQASELQYAKKLYISDGNLSPKNLGRLLEYFPNLEDLRVEDCKLGTLPPEIGQVRRLERLMVHQNELTSIPPEIGNLSNLRSLSIDDNQLSSLPKEIKNLKELESLDLARNQFKELPHETFQLTQLRHLSIGGNDITELPAEMAHLRNLTQLYITGCNFKEWPVVLNELTKLSYFAIRNCPIGEVSPGIKNLANLKMLELTHTELTMLPPEIGELTSLEVLDLKHNQLTELPQEIGNLKSLKKLKLARNHFASLPPELVQLDGLTDLASNRLPVTEADFAILKQIPNLDEIVVPRVEIAKDYYRTFREALPDCKLRRAFD